MRRRSFLRSVLALGTVSLGGTCGRSRTPPRSDTAGEPPAPTPADKTSAQPFCYGDEVALGQRLPTRELGSTGVVLPQLGLGGYHLGQHRNEHDARALVEAALAEGVRFFDTAEQYQRDDDSRSERWLGASLESVRDQVFLMTKTWDPERRSAESAREHLAASLARLRTDHLDLWQLHAVASPEDVDRAFASGGAMEAILQAQADGLTRFVGVTGHADPAAHLRALQHWDAGMRFDAVQLPLNPVDAHQRSFTLQVLPELRRRGIGVIAMKTAAAGSLVDRGVASADECLRWAASLPADVIVSGMGSSEHLRANAAALRAGPLSASEAEALLARVAPQVEPGLEAYKTG